MTRTANVSYVVEAYLPASADESIQREKDVVTKAEANTLARMWSAEGFEVDVVRRDWYGPNDVAYAIVETLLARESEVSP